MLGGAQEHMTRFISCLLVCLAVLLPPRPTVACSCGWISEPGRPLLSNGQPVPTLDELSDEPVVFLGEVISSDTVCDKYECQQITLLRVVRDWSDTPLPDFVFVFNTLSTCAYWFRAGDCVLVFPEPDAVPMEVSSCSRTDRLERSHEMLPLLDRAKRTWPHE